MPVAMHTYALGCDAGNWRGDKKTGQRWAAAACTESTIRVGWLLRNQEALGWLPRMVRTRWSSG